MSHFSELDPTYQSRMNCNPRQPPVPVELSDHCPEGHDSDEYRLNSNLKPHSTQSIAKWLDNNYHYEDGICLPRSTIYEHYVDHCQRNNLQPVNAASFGKIIRQQYPILTTRRLGTRGQSKYHYFGLGIKSTSRYCTSEYLDKQHGQGPQKKDTETKKPHSLYAASEKPSAVLPQFPDVKSLDLPRQLSKDKLHTFMVMYRAHCQRILDSVVRATFSEVENFLFHFWQGMPSHLLPILASDIVVDLIAVCDITLYKAISSVYIINPLQSIPENVTQEVQVFSDNLKGWLDSALKGLPDSLKEVKYQSAEVFNKSLLRQRSLMELAEATRSALQGDDPLEKLEADWCNLDKENVLAHALFATQSLKLSDQCADLVPKFLDEFTKVISEQNTSVEDFIVWVEDVIDRCISKKKNGSSVRKTGRTFLLTWNFFTSNIVREFTLMSASSFGTFHLIHTLIDDYILHSLELMLENEQEELYSERIRSLESMSVDEGVSNNIMAATPASTNSTQRILKTSSISNLSLIAEPPMPFSLGLTSPQVNNSSPTISTSTDLSPEQTFGNILPHPSLVSLHGSNEDSYQRHNMSLSASASLHLHQHGREPNASADPLTEPTTLQGLMSSHGIGAFNSPHLSSVTTAGDNSQSHRQQYASNLSNSSSVKSVPSTHLERNRVSSPVSNNMLSYSQSGRLQDPSLSMSFTQANPQMSIPSNLNSFGLPTMVGNLSLPAHLGSDHSISFEVANLNPSDGSLLCGPSNQSRNFPQLMAGTGKGHTQNMMSVSTSSNPRHEIGAVTSFPMSFSHPIMSTSGNLGGLPNSSGLPLLPGMSNIYPYPYAGPFPTLPSHSVNNTLSQPPIFPMPTQGLSRYPPYISPTLYGNSQSTITSRNFTS